MKDEDTQPYDRVIAEFRPERTDDLRAGSAEWIGREAEWVALWRIDPEDGGPYVGQIAWSVSDPTLHPPFAWVPSCDLQPPR